MQMRYFWKISHLMGIFPWEKILTENSHAFMDMPTDNGQLGKVVHIFNGHGGHLVRAVACCAKG
jgi:hypothetical protein